MSNKPDRRKFIKNLGIGGLTAGILPSSLLERGVQSPILEEPQPFAGIPDKRNYNGAYTGEFLNRVAFPIGGIGAGMFCMEGTGAISHMSVRNRPDIFNEPGIFAAIAIKGLKNGSKLLEGPVPDWKKFGQRDAGNGASGATTG